MARTAIANTDARRMATWCSTLNDNDDHGTVGKLAWGAWRRVLRSVLTSQCRERVIEPGGSPHDALLAFTGYQRETLALTARDLTRLRDARGRGSRQAARARSRLRHVQAPELSTRRQRVSPSRRFSAMVPGKHACCVYVGNVGAWVLLHLTSASVPQHEGDPQSSWKPKQHLATIPTCPTRYCP